MSDTPYEIELEMEVHIMTKLMKSAVLVTFRVCGISITKSIPKGWFSIAGYNYYNMYL